MARLRQLIGALSLVLLPVLSAQDLVWTNRTSPPTTQPLREVFSTPGLFLAVGEKGTLLTSPNGSVWSAQEVPTVRPLTTAAAGNGRYLIGDAFGSVYLSTDAVNWSLSASLPDNLYSTPVFTHLAFGNGVFVRAISGRGVSVSTDGVTWTAARASSGTALPDFSSNYYTDPGRGRLTFHAGTFYLLSGADLWTSTDGATWSRTALTDGSPAYTTGLAIGAGRFVIARGDTGIISTTTIGGTVVSTSVGGGYLTSADGLTWTSVTTLNLAAVNFVNGRFYALEAVTNATLTSLDGSTWTPVTTAAEGPFVLQAVHDGLRYVSLSGQQVYSSTDGLVWNLRQTVAPLPVPGNVVYGAGRYVAGGLRSTDGLTWTRDGFTPPTDDYWLRTVFCHDRFFFFETATRSATPASPRSVFISLDGRTVTQTLLMPTTAGEFHDVTYGNGQFILLSSSGIYTSTDGQTWRLSSTDLPGQRLAYGAGLFVAVGQQSIQTSPDGLTWTIRYTIPPHAPGTGPYPMRSLSGVVYGRDRFVVLFHFMGKVIEGSGANALVSTDGLAWTFAESRFGIGATGLTFVNGLFAVAASGTSYATVNDRYLHLSYDGLHWEQQDVRFRLGSLAGDSLTLVGADDLSTLNAVNLYHAQLPAPTPPVITGSQLASTNFTRNDTVWLSVQIESNSPITYQWRHNGVAIPGATRSTYSIAPATGASGTYDVVINSLGGTTVSSAATITLADSWLANVSSRAYVGTGEDVLIQGFVVESPATAPLSLLARAVGPTLASFGLSDVLADPVLSLARQSDGTALGRNDNWPSADSIYAPVLIGLFHRLGAFELPIGSADSVLGISPVTGGYSFAVSGADGGSGTALSELYDSTSNYRSNTPGRLINLSARARAGSGDRTLILGFVISGDRPLTVLLRGVGPGLAQLGLKEPLSNPKITLYNAAGSALHNNDTWHQAANVAALRAATATVGAFALAEDSNDAAMLETLAPGVYTLVISSQDETSGVALAEVYALP